MAWNWQGSEYGMRLFPTGEGINPLLATQYLMDGVTGAVTIIDYAHHEIHEGDTYRAGGVYDAANGASIAVLLRTPNTTKLCHAIGQIMTTLEAEYLWAEGATVTDAGTPATIVNRKRDSTNTAGLKVYTAPTYSLGAGSVTLAVKHWGLGRNTGSDQRDAEEWILKPNTDYILLITSRGGAGTTNYLNWWWVWYEHTDVVTP